jgi:hypothetical protein
MIWSMRALNVSVININIFSCYLKFVEIWKEQQRLQQKQRLMMLLEELWMGLRVKLLRSVERKLDQLDRLMDNLQWWVKLQILKLCLMKLGLNQ